MHIYLPRALIKIVHFKKNSKLVVEDYLPPSSSSLYIVNRFMFMYIRHVNIITNVNLNLLIQYRLNKTMLLPQADKYSEMEKFVPENKLKFVDLQYP